MLCVVAKLPVLPDNYSTSCRSFYASSLPWIGPRGLWREDSSYFTPGADTLVNINTPPRTFTRTKREGVNYSPSGTCTSGIFFWNWVVDSNIVEDERSHLLFQLDNVKTYGRWFLIFSEGRQELDPYCRLRMFYIYECCLPQVWMWLSSRSFFQMIILQ